MYSMSTDKVEHEIESPAAGTIHLIGEEDTSSQGGRGSGENHAQLARFLLLQGSRQHTVSVQHRVQRTTERKGRALRSHLAAREPPVVRRAPASGAQRTVRMGRMLSAPKATRTTPTTNSAL
ncbi:hypothetical protein [Streptomyces sp. KL116D]|uniref:hypothetical protein n=1 Tax=Streptomyces sp. KL116D TaxID=3045152 RepID=UPI0035564DED